MRILLPNHFPLEGSGSGIYTQNVARELVAKGHAALTITPAHAEQTGFPFETRSILFTPSGASMPNAQRLPFNFPCFTTHPLSSLTFGDLDHAQLQMYVQIFLAAIQEAVRDWKPDLIHAQHLWVTPYAAAKTGLPTIATAHGTDLMGFQNYPAWREIALEGAHRARAIIAISKQVAAETRSLYDVPKEQIHIIMNGFDQAVFHEMDVQRSQVLREHGLSFETNVLLLFVGKLTEFKGVDVLLDAAALYERVIPAVHTLIIGDGELRAALRTQAKELGLQGVHFLGHQSQGKISRLLNVADLCIVPSRAEPFGLVAVEALACGTPVVATNEGGLPDFIDERVGALVDVDDPHGLAKTIVSEIRQDAKAKKGAFAAAFAREGFSWSSQVEKMLSLYRKTLASHAA